MSNRRSTADFPRNEAGLVDEFIGTAYDTVKNVYDNLPEIQRLDGVLEEIPELAADTAKAAAEEAVETIRIEIQEIATEADNTVTAGRTEIQTILTEGSADIDQKISTANQNMTTQVSNATVQAQAAAAARDAARINAGIYPTVAAGLAAVVADAYFNVIGSTSAKYLDLYRKVNGVAVLVTSYPSSAEVTAQRVQLDSITTAVENSAARMSDRYSEDLLFSLTDAAYKRTWLEANAATGGPSNWSEELIRRSLQMPKEGRTGYLFTVTDASNRMTDLTVREEDGQVPDWVIDRWASRIANKLSISGGTVKSNDRWVNADGELLLATPNMKQSSGWGSSTIDEWNGELRTQLAKLGMTYYNGGNGATELQHTMAQMGVRPARLLPVGGVIPGSGAVQVTCSNVTVNAAFYATSGVLAGVSGVMRYENNSYWFVRSVAGESVPVPTEQPFYPYEGNAHRADFMLINGGKNDINAGYPLADIQARHEQMFRWSAGMIKRMVVITHFGQTGNGDTNHTQRVLTYNAWIRDRYRNLVWDLAAYLMSPQVWIDTGFTPTAADLQNQAVGCLPGTLSRDNFAHMNPTTRAAAAIRLREYIQSQNWV